MDGGMAVYDWLSAAFFLERGARDYYLALLFGNLLGFLALEDWMI